MLSNVCDWLYYLTKPFGQAAFSVRWYAQVRGHELVTRRDLLPDEPDHPRAEQQPDDNLKRITANRKDTPPRPAL